MKKALFAGLLLLPLVFAFQYSKTVKCGECEPPANLARIGQGSHSATFSWHGVDESTGYKVWYVNGDYTSPEYFTAAANYTFTNLTSGVYTIYVKTVCDGGESSIIGVEDVLQL